MSFALTNFKMYPLKIEGPSLKRGLQVIELSITRGAAGDTVCDYGVVGGTFWTAAIANNSFGDFAKKALDAYLVISSKIEALQSHEIVASNGFHLRAGSTSATQHTLTNPATFPAVTPVVTFANNANPTSVKIIATFALKDEVEPVTFI